jgi:hypothetical protein
MRPRVVAKLFLYFQALHERMKKNELTMYGVTYSHILTLLRKNGLVFSDKATFF